MIHYSHNPPLTNQLLNNLFSQSWHDHQWRDFQPVLKHALGYIGAFSDDQLIGFIHIAWDGDQHAFILDPTVSSSFQRQGIGTQLLTEASAFARGAGVVWLHVDFEPHLSTFYRRAGFEPTIAGIKKLGPPSHPK